MLTAQQKKAVKAYMRGLTKKAALLEAGYSESTARSDAHSVFDNPEVKKEIEMRQKRASKRANVTEDWIVERLMKIADANMGEMLELDEHGVPSINWEKMSPDMAYALNGMKVKTFLKGRGSNARPVTEIDAKLADKLRALEMLMKYLGLGVENVKVEGDAALIERLHAGRKRAHNKNRAIHEGSGEAAGSNNDEDE